MKSKKLLLWVSAIILVASAVLTFAFWLFQLDRTIQSRLSGRRFAPPVELYSAPYRLRVGQKIEPENLRVLMERFGYRERNKDQGIGPGDFALLTLEDCKKLFEFAPETISHCLALSRKSLESTSDFQLAAFDSGHSVISTHAGRLLEPVDVVSLDSVLFAQYIGDDPVVRDEVTLGDVPPLCLNAVLAIEDSEFLDHSGVSTTGLLRALLKNIRAGRYAQGGSTITQQLVKNYFLTHEKKLSRKIKEMAMAILMEQRASKDQILEIYINEVYLGQNGPFQIHGFGAASRYYFNKPLSELNLSECALLAALVNGPGFYDPFTKPDRAQQRRSKVLSRMSELSLISVDEANAAEKIALPKSSQSLLSEPAPYFVDAVRRYVKDNGISTENGLRIYTTLDPFSQETAQKTLRAGLEEIVTRFKTLKDKSLQGKNLEGLLVAADPSSGEVTAIVGGRDFRKSQYNRAIQSSRQIGSIMKPLVYEAAFELGSLKDQELTPITLLDDIEFTEKYDKQNWSPVNYDKKFYGQIPLFYALGQSLNVSTAKLGLDIGLSQIIDSAKRFGVEVELKSFPSLTLGAFEVPPLQVLQVYSTFANFGDYQKLKFIRQIENLDGDIIQSVDFEKINVADPSTVAIVNGLLKYALEQGTGKAALAYGLNAPAAGKTGTTSDTKDAWYAGFSPDHAAVVWVGYDDNTPTGLTGASGALPIWSRYMKALTESRGSKAFNWPDSVIEKELDEDLLSAFVWPEHSQPPKPPVKLIFRN